jgi:hypothetical protein
VDGLAATDALDGLAGRIAALEAYDALTDAAAARLAVGDLDLELLAGAGRYRRLPVLDLGRYDEAEAESLSLADDRVRGRRQAVTGQVEEAYRDRLPLLLAACWVAGGRAPRRHQDRYRAFVEVAEQECGGRGVDYSFGIASHTDSHVLPGWLAAVGAGQAPVAVTRRMAGTQAGLLAAAHRPVPQVEAARVAWASAGARWAALLDGLALGHGGEVLAIWHEDRLALPAPLAGVFPGPLPHARLAAGPVTWVAARVPAVLGLFLATRDHGLTGLVLATEGARGFDPARCARFLRNLVTHLGMPGLADLVQEQSTEPVGGGGGEALPERLRSFDTGLHGDTGLTLADCVLPVRAAMAGYDL